MTRDSSDLELVRAFQAGDRAAFDLLYDRFLNDVRLVCARYLLNADDRDDVGSAFAEIPLR